MFGPPLQKITSLDSLNESAKNIWNVVNGSFKDGCPPTFVPIFVDVRDVALAHVRAVEREEAKGQRYLLIGGLCVSLRFTLISPMLSPSSGNEAMIIYSNVQANENIVDIVARSHPEIADRLPKVDVSKVTHDGHFTFDSSKAERQLGIRYTSLEDSVKDTADRLLELEKMLN